MGTAMKDTANPPSEFPTLAELAALLPDEPQTIYDWRTLREEPPASRPTGGKLAFRRQGFGEWLEISSEDDERILVGP
jgi:hypothetical protein